MDQAGSVETHLPLSPQLWDYKCVPMCIVMSGISTWVLGMELRSSCLQGKNCTEQFLSPASALECHPSSYIFLSNYLNVRLRDFDFLFT